MKVVILERGDGNSLDRKRRELRILSHSTTHLKPIRVFPKYWYPQIIHFDRVFHYKPSILWGTPIFGNTHKGLKLSGVSKIPSKVKVG